MASEATRPFPFVQITDLHVGSKTSNPAAPLIEDLRQIQHEVGHRGAFIAATGDLTDRGIEEGCRMYCDAVGECRLKIHPVAGNHDYVNDTWQEPKMDAGWYQKLIGPTHSGVPAHAGCSPRRSSGTAISLSARGRTLLRST